MIRNDKKNKISMIGEKGINDINCKKWHDRQDWQKLQEWKTG